MHQIKTFIYALAFSIACTAFFMQYIAVDAHASSLSRKEIICQKGFIGYEYNPKLEKRCRGLWNQWTENIKKSFDQNP